MDRKTAQHVRLKIYIFLSRPLQNNNVKSSELAWCGKGNPNGKLFKFGFGAQRCPNTSC